MAGPGMVGPGMAGPGMVGPGMAAPGMAAPGMVGFSGVPQVYEPPKKSKAWIVILVIVLVLVLAAGALFAFGRIGFSGCSQNGFMNYHEQEDSFYAENDVPPSYAASVQDGEAFSYIVEEGTATLTDYHFKTEITDNATGEYGRYLAGSVVVPETIDGYTVAALGDYLFYGCRFESITLPDTLTYIGPGAFSYAMFENGTVEIPDSVTAIAEEAFYRSNYSHIQLPEGLGYIGDFAFAETDLSGETVFIPSKVETLFEYSFFNSGISGFDVDFENPYFYMKKEHLCGDGIMIDSSGSPIALG
ncbi:MAG: leucine-rich repeat domain-containing protein [Ruminococcaceae bacterium]|nr:leucine-rich repeat domain-containing protein [Oscillospiraceae bacterium]